eukprot:m.131369 g.131369  ORF g.131369 m.131369 type:complete len:98 (+) comp23728_c0_seq1:102-395(+)
MIMISLILYSLVAFWSLTQSGSRNHSPEIPFPLLRFKHFVYFCDALNSWQQPKEDLHQTFYEILHAFKDSVGFDVWNKYFNKFPPPLQESLRLKYEL